MSEAWNLRGKTVLITGATSGIGFATAEALVALGAELVLLGRDRSRGSAAIGLLRRIDPGARLHFIESNFTRLADVHVAAERFLALDLPLHVLVNNAGILNLRRRLSEDCVEEMFAVNYLAHYLLTRMLLARMHESGAARIVHVASHAHAWSSSINFLDINHGRHYRPFLVYGHSKLANILFSNELSRRLQGSRVSSNALHPGLVATRLGSNVGLIGRLVPLLLRPLARSAEQGAETVVHLASSPELEGVSGGYFVDCRESRPRLWATDVGVAARLWNYSEKLVSGYL